MLKNGENMNEELKFTITAESNGVKKGASEAVSALNNVGNAYESSAQKGARGESVAAKMAERLKRVGRIGTEAQIALSKAAFAMTRVNRTAEEARDALAKYNGMSKLKLTSELDKINTKLNQQKQQLEQAQEKLAEYLDVPLDMFEYLNRFDTHALEIAVDTDEYRELISVITQTQEAIKNLQTQQFDCNAALENMDGMQVIKKNSDKAKVSIDAVGFVLSSLSNISNGAIGQLAGLAQQIRYLKQGFSAAAQGAGGLGIALTTGLGAVSVAVSAISSITSSMKAAKEEMRNLAETSANNYSIFDVDLSNAERYISALENQSSSLEEVREAKEGLAELFPEIIQGYKDEESSILDIIKSLKEEYEWRAKIAKIKTEETATGYQITSEEIQDLVKDYKKLIAAREGAELIGDEENVARFDQKIAAQKSQIIDKLEQAKTEITANLEIIFGKDIAAQLSGALSSMFGNIYEQIVENNGDIDIENILKSKLDIAKWVNEAIEANGAELNPEAINILLTKAFSIDDIDEAGIQALVEEYFKIDAAPIVEGLAPQLQDLRWQIISILNGDEGSVEESASIVDQIFGNITPETKTELEDIMTLVNALADESATAIQEMQFENFKSEGFQAIDDMIVKLNRGFSENPKATLKAIEALQDYKKQLNSIPTSLDKTEKAQKEAEEAVRDFANGGKDAIDRLSEIKNEMNSLGQQRAAIEILKKGEKSSKDYADALEYLKDEFKIDPDDIIANLQLIDENTRISEEDLASYVNLIAESSGLTFTIDDGQIVASGDNANEATQQIAEYLNAILAANGSSLNFQIKDGKVEASGKVPNLSKSNKGSGRSKGGGGSSKNSALERELALLEHKKALDQLTTQEEIDNLERILNKYAKTNEEKEDIIEKLYSLRKQKAKEDLEYQKAMDQLTLREEIAAIDAQLATYKAGTQARRELEKERYALAKELQRQEYDLKVYYGQLTLKQQEQQLSLMLADYKKGTQARIDLEKELYDIQQQIRENGISRIDSVADGIIQALSNRYAEQQRIETERLEESKENWKKWGDEQVEALQKQIDALDELTKQEDKEEQERQKRRKVASLEQQLLYETDLYNQMKLQEQLADARKELDDWLRQQEREELKASLQEQINQVQQKVEAEQEKIDKQIEANDKYYEELTKEQNLQAEAQKLLMKNNQAEILDLLKNFAPEYNLTGQSLGEQLVDGFMGKVADIEAWFNGLTARFTQYQNQIAAVATQAADEFYRSYGVATSMQNGVAATGAVTASSPQITMIFNQPVESPTEIRREMERLAEQLSNL